MRLPTAKLRGRLVSDGVVEALRTASARQALSVTTQANVLHCLAMLTTGPDAGVWPMTSFLPAVHVMGN